MATEKRLIDAIALIGKARRMETTDNDGIPVDTFAVPVLVIEDAPTVDAVEVVRCRECKHCVRDHTLDAGGDEYYYCTNDVMEHGQARANEFCSYGERKNND